jgi:low temperature requirement protein LtrA
VRLGRSNRSNQLQAVRELHAHHEARQGSLRERNPDLYDEFDGIKKELDALSNEFHLLTAHGVALDANFSKFGYSAHLRTKDVVDSSDSSISGHAISRRTSHDWDAERSSVEGLKFWKRPVVRQYFHKGLLWRSGRSGEVASFELFIDLLYVGVIDIIGEKTIHHPTGKSLLEFIITFTIGWKIWSDITMVVNWFEVDDVFQRICVLFYVVCLLGFTTNIEYAFETTYTSMIAFYLTQRLSAGAYYLWVGYLVPTVSGTMITNALIVVVSASLWIGSIHVAYPAQLALIFLALTIDVFGSLLVVWLMKMYQNPTAGKVPWISKYFEFYPAVNIEHRVERNNAFVTLVFGYSVLTIIFQSHASFGINAFLGKAILGLVQAFAFNWIYFEIDQGNIHMHAIRRHWFSGSTWLSAHLPFIMSYVLAAATLTKLVIAHDVPNADAEHDLGERYSLNSVGELEDGMRWYYCGGLGVSLIFMSVISLCHVHKKLPNSRLVKRFRLAMRCCIAIVIICLPLAHSLNSLHLISITTSLVVLVLALDIFGNSCQGDEFWSGGFCEAQKRSCKYSAECKVDGKMKKEVEAAMKKGQKVKLENLMGIGKKDGARGRGVDEEKGVKDQGWSDGHTLLT